MRTPRIFTDQLLASDTHIQLEVSPSQHLARALRMSVGEPLVLFDGRGGEYPAEIAELDKRRVFYLVCVVVCQVGVKSKFSPVTTTCISD